MNSLASTARLAGLAAAALLLATACDSPGGQSTTPGDTTTGDTTGTDAGSTDAATGDTTSGDTATGDTATGDTTTGDAMTLDQFSTTWFSAVCNRLVTCVLPGDDFIFLQAMISDSATCANMLSGSFNAGQASWSKAVDDGRVLFDGAKAAACLAELDSCAVFQSSSPAPNSTVCREMLQGTVAVGQPCTITLECAGDAYCDNDAQCPGICTARKALGATCEYDKECTQDSAAGMAECQWGKGTSEATCVATKLEAAVGAGAACGDSDVTDNVITRTPCQDGLWCKRAPDTNMGTCVAPTAAGAACDDLDDPCVHGYVCFPDVTDGEKTCKPAPVVNEAGGGPCGVDGPGAKFCNTFKLLTCDEATNTCQPLPDGVEGAACNAGDFGGMNCHDGLGCDSETNTCQPLRAAGQPCQDDGMCQSHSCDWHNDACNAEYCD